MPEASTWSTLNIEPPDYPLGVTSIASTIRSESEAGYVITRPRYTRTRKRWSLKWAMMSASDYTSLETFFNETTIGGANSFTWDHPITGTIYTVRFAEDELSFNLSTPGVSGFYEGSVTLLEV
jgi:hypothetical protein